MSAARASNKSIKLGKTVSSRVVLHPKLKIAQKVLVQAQDHLHLLTASPNPHPDLVQAAGVTVKFAKTDLRRVTRSVHLEADTERDAKLHTILTSNHKIFKVLFHSKHTEAKSW